MPTQLPLKCALGLGIVYISITVSMSVLRARAHYLEPDKEKRKAFYKGEFFKAWHAAQLNVAQYTGALNPSPLSLSRIYIT